LSIWFVAFIGGGEIQLQEVLEGLSRSDSNVRLKAIYILALVDETRALPTLGIRFSIETDPKLMIKSIKVRRI
jgi:hypothetical protein